MAPAEKPKPADIFDGRRLKALTSDPGKFKMYIDQKFQKLDTSGTGALTAEQLQPAVAEWGNLLGLPPMGTSEDANTMYSEITKQYLDESKKGGNVDRRCFEVVTRDILLGIADSLESNPVSIDTIDGSQLRYILADSQKAEFQLLSDRAFEQINTDLTAERTEQQQNSSAKGGKSAEAPAASESAMSEMPLSAPDAVALALKKHLTIAEGVPPASSQRVEALINQAVQQVVSHNRGKLSKEEFANHLRAALQSLAQGLQAHPVTVAHTEKEVKGEKIKPFVEDKDGFARAVHQLWEEDAVNGKFPKSEFWTALDRMGGQAGLPPLGASEAMDNVYDKVIGNREGTTGEYATEEELRTHLQEALFLVGASLTAQPVSVKVAQVVGDENDATSLSGQKEQQVGGVGQTSVQKEQPVGGHTSVQKEQPVGGHADVQKEQQVGGHPDVQREQPVGGHMSGQAEQQVGVQRDNPVTGQAQPKGVVYDLNAVPWKQSPENLP